MLLRIRNKEFRITLNAMLQQDFTTGSKYV